MNLIERTERDILDVDNQLRSYEDRKFYLEGQLATTNPMGPMISGTGERIQDPVTRLKAARTEYLSASSKYSADHPDVIRLRREIAGLEKETGAVDSTIELAKEISKLRADLATAREKYSEDHPDVVRLTKTIAAQEGALKQKQAAAPERSAAIEKPDNPNYVNLKAQVETVNAEIKSLNIKRNELKTKLAGLEKKILSTPEVERKYLVLKRDQENAVKRYQDIKTKQMEAEVGQELEKERKGERFALIDPAQLPEEPVKPNRPAIIILGFLLSMAGGVGYAAVAEGVDSSVRGMRGVAALLDAPLLSVIPYMKNSEDLARAEKTKKRVIGAFAGGLVLLVLLVHFLWTPLDVLWFRGLRKVGTVIGG